MDIQNSRSVILSRLTAISLTAGVTSLVSFETAIGNFNSLWSISAPTRVTINRTGIWAVYTLVLLNRGTSIPTQYSSYILKNGVVRKLEVVNNPDVTWPSPLNIQISNFFLGELKELDYIEMGLATTGGTGVQTIGSAGLGYISLVISLVNPYFPGTGPQERQ